MGLKSILSHLEALSFLKGNEKKAGRQAYLAQLLGGRRARPTKDDGEKSGEEKRENRAMRGSLYHPRPIPPVCDACHTNLSMGLCLNRRCRNSALKGGGVLADREDQRRSLIRQINELDVRRKTKTQDELRTMSARGKRARAPHRAGFAMERRLRLEARLNDVEAQIKVLRKVA